MSEDERKRARTSMSEHERRPNEHDQVAGTGINKHTTECTNDRERARPQATQARAGVDERRRVRGQTNGGNGGRGHTQRAGVCATPAGAAATVAAPAPAPAATTAAGTTAAAATAAPTPAAPAAPAAATATAAAGAGSGAAARRGREEQRNDAPFPAPPPLFILFYFIT
jgi:hypothetical protein